MTRWREELFSWMASQIMTRIAEDYSCVASGSAKMRFNPWLGRELWLPALLCRSGSSKNVAPRVATLNFTRLLD